MRFRLVAFFTESNNKYHAERHVEYFGDRESIWHLWFLLTQELHHKHVEVYSLDGRRLDPDKGLAAMIDYQP